MVDRMKWRIVFLACSILPFINGKAQQFSTEIFNVRKGLPQSQVLSLAEDKKLGYLWLGTNGGGLARFDGKTFTSYTVEDGIRDNSIYRIFIDSHDNIWASTGRGLSKFDGRSFKNFKSLPNIFSGMVEFQDTLFALALNSRVVKIYKDSVYHTNAKYPDKNSPHIIWMGSNSTDYFYYMMDNAILVRRDKTGSRKINTDAAGKIWNCIPSGDSILLISSSGAWAWGKKGLALVDAKVNFRVLAASADFSTLWRRKEDGIEKVTRTKEGWVAEEVARDIAVNRVLIDSEGNTWLGTDGKGLLRYYRNDFQRLNDGIVMTVLHSGDKLWAGKLYGGIDILQGDKLVRHLDEKELGLRTITEMKRDKTGGIWVSGGDRIAKISESDYSVKQFPGRDSLSATIGDLEIDANNRIWIGYSGGGLGFWQNGQFHDFPLNQELTSGKIFCLKYLQYGERLLVCGASGVDEIRNESISRLSIPSLNETAVLCATGYRNKYVIFGTDGRGICIYDLDRKTSTHYTKKEGLVSGLIYFVNVDNDGYLWVGSDHGIERIKLNDRLEIDEYLYFSDANGLTGLETNLHASFISGRSKFFGLVDGAYRFQDKAQPGGQGFGLHFTNVRLLYADHLEQYSAGATGFFKIPQQPDIPFEQNSIAFSFTRVCKKYPESSEYKFMLEGLDQQWSLHNTDKEIVYRNLPSGNYTFKVLARDDQGRWIRYPLEYGFTISPPFYRTATFITVAILFIVMLIVLIIYYNVRRKFAKIMAEEKLKREENIRLRREIGRDFHDEIGNQLARIVNYTSMIKLKEGETIQTISLVEESAKNLIVGTRDLIWALDPENDSTSNLFIHLRDFADRLLSEMSIEFRAFYEVQAELKMPVGYTRQLNLIMKEVITNSFKYSRATRVDLIFKELLFGLKITYKDNGAGIPQSKLNQTRGGLVNMKVRADRIGAKLNIESSEHGTEISLIVKI